MRVGVLVGVAVEGGAPPGCALILLVRYVSILLIGPICINCLFTYFTVVQTPVGEKYYVVGVDGRGGILQHA